MVILLESPLPHYLSRVLVAVCWTLALTALVDAQCLTAYEQCEEDMDCCSGQCISLKCNTGCIVDTHPCSEDSQCCGGTCYRHDITMELGTCFADAFCQNGGTACNISSECCSFNCYNAACQPGTGRCTFPGGLCQFHTDCCEGTRCGNNHCSASVSLHHSGSSSYILLILMTLCLLNKLL